MWKLIYFQTKRDQNNQFIMTYHNTSVTMWARVPVNNKIRSLWTEVHWNTQQDLLAHHQTHLTRFGDNLLPG